MALLGRVKVTEINFSNPAKVYRPGDLIEGNVLLETSETLSMKGIAIRFKGYSQVMWTENNGQYSTTYTSTETYLTFQEWLCGPEQEGVVLAAGQHVYPFKYLLPKGIPSSFLGLYGYIKYSATAVAHRLETWKPNQKLKEVFTVISPMYLNVFTDTMTEVRDTGEKTVCCWWCASGPITATFYVPRKGYVMGEKVTFRADIENFSMRDVTTWVLLCQRNSFYAAGKCNVFKIDHGRVQGPAIPAGRSEVWEGDITVPELLPPTRMLHCNNIDVDYSLKLFVKPTFPAFNFRVRLDIYVGTVPYSPDLDPEVIEAEIAQAALATAGKGTTSTQELEDSDEDQPEGTEVKGDKGQLVLDQEPEKGGGETSFSNPTYRPT